MSDDQMLYDLVVVGASAGGIEALSTLVATLPADFPAPIVVAQHLDPDRPSHLADILERRSTLPVRSVADAEPQPLTPGVVYVVPADRDVEITDHLVRLRAGGARHPKPSINLLLSSAAHAHGERLIAVILTGTGTDGADGAREVKAAAGMVIIQNPRTAAYPTMPASLAPTTVDVVADLEQIGALLADLLSGVSVPAQPDQADALQALLEQVRAHSGIDFGNYKRPTILRRLQRRLAATAMPTLFDYTQYLASHPDEYQRLVASFLINVTEFFRDPELFELLREQVLPELIAHARTQGNELRLWSAGCATGEEAYSLAILVAEALGTELEQFAVQIFATDLDPDAVAFARRGIYPATALAGLPDERVARYFRKVDGEYEVNKRVRSLTIFGVHDLGQRAAFPRIDLVLCRNVLIYFTPELQQRVLQLFAYSVREGGYLLLGPSESTGPLADLFAAANPHVKLFRRQGHRVTMPAPQASSILPPLAPLVFPGPVAPATPLPARAPQEPRRARTASEQLGELVLELPIGVVVVDRHYDIRAINAAAHRLLGIFRPAVGEDLIHLAEGLPSSALRGAIDAAFRKAALPAVEQVVTMETALGERRDLQIACYPQESEEAAPPEYVVILATDVTSAAQARRAAEESAAEAQRERETSQAHDARNQQEARSRERRKQQQALQRQQDEITRLKAHVEQVTAINRDLVEANQELTASNLRLRGSYEELVVTREEGQSTTEEIKTLNEELQASNEELVTVNEELEATAEELHTSNEDLQARTQELQSMAASLEGQRQASEAARAQLEAILLSMGDALLVVDLAGAALMTNAAYGRMFGSLSATFAPEDEEGRPLPPDATPQRRAAGDTAFSMTFSLNAADGTRRWFEAQGEPIRGQGELHGGVVTIRDITERNLTHLQNEFMVLASHELRSPLTVLNVALEMIARHLPPDAAETERTGIWRYTNQALYQVHRMRVLVNDLLDVGRLQTGKLTLTLEPMDLVASVRQIVEAVQLGTTSNTLTFEAQDDRPLRITGDATRVEQVLANLLTNAIQHAPRSEQIDVRLREVEGTAELRVQDYGPGIPAADLPRLFTRFHRTAPASGEGRSGMGLGLYITREVVMAHGGTVMVESEEGKGTVFIVRFPLVDAVEAVSAPLSQQSASAD
jgi:two-component system, chemotaxis family, CheB/CheR fusion protein